MTQEELHKTFQEWFNNEGCKSIKWIDAKHLKDTLPQGKGGHFVSVVKENDITSRLLFLIKAIQKPIPDNAPMQKPIWIEERKRVFECIEKAFKGVIPENFKQYYENYGKK